MMLIDMAGMKFGRWTVLRRAISIKGQTMWLCRCECGNENIINGGDLRRGNSKSCGCLGKEIVGNRFRRHGEAYSPTTYKTPTPLYRVWISMKNRCYDPNSRVYKNYGGRGDKSLR
jgi:hypothetical protein